MCVKFGHNCRNTESQIILIFFILCDDYTSDITAIASNVADWLSSSHGGHYYSSAYEAFADENCADLETLVAAYSTQNA